VVGIDRTSLLYRPQTCAEETQLRTHLPQLARERRRLGYRRLYVLLQLEGLLASHKRIERLHREEPLTMRRRGHARIVAAQRGWQSTPAVQNIDANRRYGGRSKSQDSFPESRQYRRRIASRN
jgi:putative transposase